MAASRNSSGRLALILSAVGALMLAAAVAVAEPPAVAAAQPTSPARAGTTLTMEQAVRMAEQRYKARVVRAEPDHSGEHTVYVLRMLNDKGRVWTVRVDAASGAWL